MPRKGGNTVENPLLPPYSKTDRQMHEEQMKALNRLIELSERQIELLEEERRTAAAVGGFMTARRQLSDALQPDIGS